MNRIDGLLKEFSTGADRIESSLSSMLTMVSGGRVPAKSEIQALEQELDGLQRAFDSIQLLASEAVAEGELPGVDSSVSDYAEAIRYSEVLRIKEQIIEIENRLRRFISVKFLMAAFEGALKPYQKAAQDILSQIGREASPSPSELEKATEAHKLFLEAMATEDFDSDAGMDLMEKLEVHYSSKVQRGLMLNKYYIEESAPVLEESKKTEAVERPVSEESGQDGAADTEEQVDQETVTNEPAPVEEIPPAQEAVDEEEDAEEEPPKPKMVKANSKVKVKSASAASFKNDILNMSHEVCTILPLFTNLGALTADQIYAFGCCMDCFDPSKDTQENVEKVLDMLIAKNIVASYSPSSFDRPIYCLTAYGHDSMFKRSIAVDMKKMFAIFFGKYRFIGKDEMPVALLLYAVLHNTFLLMYIENMKNELREDVFELTKQSIRWEGDHYSINVFADDSSYKCYVGRIRSTERPLPSLHSTKV